MGNASNTVYHQAASKALMAASSTDLPGVQVSSQAYRATHRAAQSGKAAHHQAAGEAHDRAFSHHQNAFAKGEAKRNAAEKKYASKKGDVPSLLYDPVVSQHGYAAEAHGIASSHHWKAAQDADDAESSEG